VPHLIFPAGPDDAEDLARVHVAAWRETYRGLLPDAYLNRMSEAAHAQRWRRTLTSPNPDEVVLAAANRGGLIGYAAGGASRYNRAGEMEIATLYILRGQQRRGLGRALVAAAARVFAAQGATSLVISTLRDNLPARGFYEHLGGVAEDPRPERGPGGVMHEVSYRWADVLDLTR
jgi:ribosomal protein S18 acetylase RimI-like enzyme